MDDTWASVAADDETASPAQRAVIVGGFEGAAHAHVHAYLHMNVYIHMHIFVYIYVCIYICIYTYT